MSDANQEIFQNDATVGHTNRSIKSTVSPTQISTDYASHQSQQIQYPNTANVMEWSTNYLDYEFLGKIGQGAFASVWRARCKSNGGKMCAVKVLNLEHVDTNFVDIRLEVQTMRLSSHQNILACFTSFTQDTNLLLVTQLMDKGSSLQCIQSARLKLQQQQQILRDGTIATFEEHTTYILYETIMGLKYIHENGQIHRDVKAGNILLDSDANVRIADFGVSGWLVDGGQRRENTRTFVGTPCWMAPEVMEQVHGYDYKADIWSLGITALELAKGYAPYARYAPMKVLLMTIQEEPPSLETYEDDDDIEKWSESFRDMIAYCLQKDPSKRPNCTELLSHRHFMSLGDSAKKEQCRRKVKNEVCDFIEENGDNMNEARSQQAQPRSSPVCVVSSSEENRAPGTTWVFSDGSQVIASSAKDEGDNDTSDFFDEFERTTQGENFQRKETNENLTNDAVESESSKIRKAEKDDMNDFFDEFEKTTGGENFKKMQ